MSEQRYTPEPWRAGPYGTVSRGDGGPLIATAVGNSGPFRTSYLADANRIVACVNACKGVDTDALQPGAVAALVEALRQCHEAACGDSHQDAPYKCKRVVEIAGTALVQFGEGDAR